MSTPRTKEQSRELSREWRAKNPERWKELCRLDYQRNIEKRRADARARSRARYWRDVDKTRAYNREKQNRNRTRYTERLRLAESKRRARIKLATVEPFTVHDWRRTLELFDYRCAYCLRKLHDLEADHFRPVARGGAHAEWNLVPACRACNASKKDLLVFDWLPRLSGRVAA
jgi:5-methylcytosine-specific restriction endonuclease McrA